MKFVDEPDPKKTRCCINCALLSSTFSNEDCPNCHLPSTEYMHWTTTKYKGRLVLLDKKRSWIGKWQVCGVEGYYAITVDALLSEDMTEILEERGIAVIDRTKNFSL